VVFFDEIIDVGVRFTNQKGRRLKRDLWKVTTRKEMEAFIGLHVLAGMANRYFLIDMNACIYTIIILGVLKAHHRHARELWNMRDGLSACLAALSYERFVQLKTCMRFDDPLRRDRNNKLAPIEEITNLLNQKLQESYTPSAFVTVDEMLIEYHGRVPFKQYTPTKPGKFGIKVFW
jgi:hypothetical protein